MSGPKMIGIWRLGAEPTCRSCGAGATTAFSWANATRPAGAGDDARVEPFVRWQPLRRGTLYRCEACDACWHLDEAREWMTHVPDQRLRLVLDWNREPIKLSSDVTALLAAIGPTPPDIYGNGNGQLVTPCSVETTSGERTDLALLCIQKDAPVQHGLEFRLASEIAHVSHSPYALPRAVREASSRTEEVRMGFSPLLIEMPDGSRLILNGRTSFVVEDCCQAAQARVVVGNASYGDLPPRFAKHPAGITYFVADG
jgi:hypothetical protein